MKRSTFHILLISVIIPILGFAQSDQEILPSERKQMTIITEPYTLYQGFFRAGISVQYGALYKIFDSDGERVPISNASGKSWSTSFIAQYGVSDRLQVTLGLPYTQQDLFLSYRGEAPGIATFIQQKLEGKGSGLGDAWLGVDYQVITETDARPSIKGLFTITLPTGSKNPEELDDPELIDIPVGRGAMAYEAGISARKIIYPYSWTGYVSYKMNTEGSKSLAVGDPEITFNDGDLWTFSGSFNFHMNEWLALVNDAYFFISGQDEEDGVAIEDSSSWVFWYSPRLSFQIKRLRVNQTIQLPLAGKRSSADPGYIMVFQYVF